MTDGVTSRHTVVAGIGAASALLLLTGCGQVDITRGRVERALGTTFVHLEVRQQSLLGRVTAPDSLDPSATCHRSAGTPDRNAGDDWVCVVHVLGADGYVQAVPYDVHIKADACYTADGPSAVIGQPTLTTSTGDTVLNPLYEFDGCIDTD